MKLAYVFIANTVFGFIGALTLLLNAEATMASYGAPLTPGGVFTAHVLGIVVLSIAVLSFLVRNITDKAAIRAILISFVIAHAGSAVLALMAVTSGLFSQMGWFDVAVHTLLTAGFGYYLGKTQK